MYWWGLVVIVYWMGCWQGQDSVVVFELVGMQIVVGLCGNLGLLLLVVVWWDGVIMLFLYLEEDVFDVLLQLCVICCNFDIVYVLLLQEFVCLFKCVFVVIGCYDFQVDSIFFKKNVLLVGGLYFIEVYLFVQNVVGLVMGIYYYDFVLYVLMWLFGDDICLCEVVLLVLVGQYWFVDVYVLVVLVLCYLCIYWKYCNYVKVYCVVMLDVGYFFQQLLLCVIQQKLGVFVIVVINEYEIECLFGFDLMVEGLMVICGVGWCVVQMIMIEFDFGQCVWEKMFGVDVG